MNRRSIISLFGIIAFGLTLLPASGIAQQKSLKDQLVGTWTVVSFDSFDGSGAKVPNMEGRDLKGELIFTDNGRYSVQLLTEFPKLASNDRLKTHAGRGEDGRARGPFLLRYLHRQRSQQDRQPSH